MTWIEQPQDCPACGTEITLYTNGREGVVIASSRHMAEELYIEDGALTISADCPVWQPHKHENCGEHLEFTGEGQEVTDPGPRWLLDSSLPIKVLLPGSAH